ncbi:MAG: hypothetical protein WCS77_05740 [Elusimicrobiaceae bacterium]|jgi:K+-sensing histidine kinase KdpD
MYDFNCTKSRNRFVAEMTALLLLITACGTAVALMSGGKTALLVLLFCSLAVTGLAVGCMRVLSEVMKRKELDENETWEFIFHDLRNPLTAIIMALSSLSKEAYPAGAPLIDIAEKSAALQEKLMKNLDNMRRIEVSGITPKFAQHNIRTILNKSITEALPFFFFGRKHQVCIDLPQDSVVYTDDILLQEIVVNFILSAAKYCPSSGTIKVCVHQDDSDVQISVVSPTRHVTDACVPYVFEKNPRGSKIDCSRHRYSAALNTYYCKLLAAALSVKTIAKNCDGGFYITVRIPLAKAAL